MCSWGVFLGTWSRGAMSSSSTCRGVLLSRRLSWVSVAILVGIRFSSRIFNGRISWATARRSVMTKMFSSFSVLAAGSSLGIRMGMTCLLAFRVLME